VSSVLVIGYGNDLRGDDAVGPQIASAVESWKLPFVRVIACHQLTPELADPISQADRVIFVDALEAAADIPATPVAAREIFPRETAPSLGHSGGPESLLALAAGVFGRCPQAFSVLVPVSCFELGAPLSPRARTGMTEALAEIRRLCAAPE